MRFKGDIAEAIEEHTHPLKVYQFGQLLSVAAVVLAVVQEYYNASRMAAYYVRSWCGGAGVVEFESSLFYGTTCTYSGGDGYWLAAPWEYFLRTENTFITEAGLSFNHWAIVAGVGAWFVFAYWINDLKQEYILDELDTQRRRFYYYHDRNSYEQHNGEE